MEDRALRNKVFILCWCAYAGAYLCKTNLSIVIPVLEDLGWGRSSIGFIGSLFFWTYAFGQLINGYIGDRVNTKMFIFISLFLSSSINILLGTISSKVIFTILWGINGFLLSMLWGPIIRTLGSWFPEGSNSSIGVKISTSMFFGYLVYWGPLGNIIKNVNWRLAFYIPGIVVLLFSLYWLITFPYEYERKDLKLRRGEERIPVRGLLTVEIMLIASACIVQGVIKESIGLWTPTIIKDIIRGNSNFALIIPVMSFLGLFLAGWINSKINHKEEVSVSIMYLMNLGICMLLAKSFGFSLYLTLLLLGFSSAILYGANVLLLANIPLRFAKYGFASTLAGFFDFSSYIGSALASIITGSMTVNLGWKTIFLLWGILSIGGALNISLSQVSLKKEGKIL